ncbi:MAG: hypothetical protein HC788_15540 [Sphingopyxis sp.]|nr:hypothetical protein [Sphingopyxis sp.]
MRLVRLSAASDVWKLSRRPRFANENRHENAKMRVTAVDKSGKCNLRIRRGKIRMLDWNLVIHPRE